jgi:hypothetical protein
MKNLYLCFFGDSALWDNIIQVMAYPDGYTYIRPFRYRDNWLHPEIMDDIKNPKKREALYSEKAILGMRFLTNSYEWLLLPIREITITKIEYMPDNHSVYFTLGPMVDFRKFKHIKDACVEIPDHERQGLSGKELFLKSSVPHPKTNFVSSEEEDYSWIEYADKIAKDNTLPFNDRAKNAMFLRLSNLNDSEDMKTGKINESKYMGKVFGLQLTEGKSYEIGIIHRIPILIGTNTTIEPINVSYESPTNNIEFNRSEETYTANYQTHTVIVTAKKPSGTSEEIIVRPAEKDDKSKMKILTDKLLIPVKINRSFGYRLQTQYIWFLLLWLSLGLLSYLAAPIITSGDWQRPVFSAIASGFASFLIFYAQNIALKF